MSVYISPQYGLRPFQKAAVFHDRNLGVAVATPQSSGKTTCAYRWLIMQAVRKPGGTFWWASPTFAQTMDAMRRVQRYLPRKHARFNKSELTCTLSNGSFIHFKSADNPESLYGATVDALVVDEASRVKDDAWAALQSRLVMTNGPIRAIGNKSGRNWFWELCKYAKENDDVAYAEMTAIDAVNEGILSQEKFDLLRKTTPPLKFDELYLLQDVESFNPFRGWEKCVQPEPSAEPAHVFGIDPARADDEYAIVGLDQYGSWTHNEHWNHTPWPVSIQRTFDICGDTLALVDQTGGIDSLLNQLSTAGCTVQGYLFGMLSRQALLERLAVGIHNGAVTFPMDIGEQLQTFEYTTLPSGRVKYMCPENKHDDRVMALALAYWQLTEGASMQSLVEIW